MYIADTWLYGPRRGSESTYPDTTLASWLYSGRDLPTKSSNLHIGGCRSKRNTPIGGSKTGTMARVEGASSSPTRLAVVVEAVVDAKPCTRIACIGDRGTPEAHPRQPLASVVGTERSHNLATIDWGICASIRASGVPRIGKGREAASRAGCLDASMCLDQRHLSVPDRGDRGQGAKGGTVPSPPYLQTEDARDPRHRGTEARRCTNNHDEYVQSSATTLASYYHGG